MVTRSHLSSRSSPLCSDTGRGFRRSMAILAVDLQRNALFSLEGKTAVLTGASGFLGRTFALALLANGARVVALGRSDRLLSEAARWEAQFGKARVSAYR